MPKLKRAMKSLPAQLSELECMRDAHRRGRLFESFISQILEEEGYKVEFNPKSAAPRQTDLFGARDGHSFLVEAKWLRKPTHVGQVSSVRERLRKCPPDVFGCIFSMSGYTEEAVQEVCNEKNPEVILFNGSEVRGMASDELPFSVLLDRKKEEIRRNATAWFSDWTPEKFTSSRIRSGPEVIRLNGQSKEWMFSSTQDDDVLFTTELLDFAGAHHNSVSSLNLQIGIYTLDDLHRLTRLLKKHLGLQGRDSFAIHQRRAGWYGLGLDAFLSTARNWKARYAELGWDSYHHSEELAYFDQVANGGLMLLSSRQRVGEHVYLHSSYLEVFFPGIPVDMSAVRRLCELTKNQGAALENVDCDPVEKCWFRPPIPVEALGTVVSPSDGEQWVTGLIVKNPFFKKRVPIPEESSHHKTLAFLSNNENLLCSMKQWHISGQLNIKYEIRYAEACWVENIPVLHVACDWSDDDGAEGRD